MKSVAILTGLLATTNAFAPAANQLSRSTTALNVAVDTSDIKNGMTIELDNEPYKVMSFSIMKQARGAAKTTIKVSRSKYPGINGHLKVFAVVEPRSECAIQCCLGCVLDNEKFYIANVIV